MNYRVKMVYDDLETSDFVMLINQAKYLSIDTETTGLNPIIHKLKIIQIATSSSIYIIKYNEGIDYKNLKLLLNSNIRKYFHNATFDVKFLIKNLGFLEFPNLVCTKICAKLINGVTTTSSLKPLLENYLGVKIDKKMQMSNWNAYQLSEEQIQYAINDVIYLSSLYEAFLPILRERGMNIFSKRCFDFVPYQAFLEINKIENIFKY